MKNELPAVGARIHLVATADTCPCPVKDSPDFIRGWADYFAGVKDVADHTMSYARKPSDSPEALYKKGWLCADGHAQCYHSHVWTVAAYEGDEIVLTRQEVNSYNDVMNGSGTGLGTHTVTKRVKV